jgi:hypothetical protein
MGPETPRRDPSDGDAARRARLVANERTLRRANERIEELNRVALLVDPPEAGEQAAFLCECSSLDCGERLDIGVEEYAEAHDEEGLFTLVPDHIDERVDRVVAERDGYVVVEKT